MFFVSSYLRLPTSSKIMKRQLKLFLFASVALHAELAHESIFYDQDGIRFEGHLIYAEGSPKPQPVLLMVPNWMGPSENAFTKARMLAEAGYAVFVADLYGVEVRPTNTQAVSYTHLTLPTIA